MSMLPSINLRFQRGQQQCAAEFFQEFCRVWACESAKAKTMALSQSEHFDLSFSKTFFFNQRSEILCLNCNKVSATSAMETVLPLHLNKVWTAIEVLALWQLTKIFQKLNWDKLKLSINCNLNILTLEVARKEGVKWPHPSVSYL